MPKPIQIENFLGGINEAFDETVIGLNESPMAQNCNIDDGTLRSISGASVYTEASLGAPIGTIMVYYKNKVPTILVSSGTKLYKLSGNVYTEIASGFTSDKFDYINYNIQGNDVVILANGTDNIKVYDGASIRDLKHDGYSSTDSELNKAPKGKYMDLHYERVWVADDDSAYFSTANVNGFDPDDWTYPLDEGEANQHGGVIDISTWDGAKNIGLKVIFDDILIFKTSAIFKIFGTYPGQYQKTQIFASSGAIADKSVVTANSKAFFLNTDGIYEYNGVTVDIISTKIKNTIAGLNKNYLQNSCGVFFNDKYILSVPEGNSTVNNLVIEYNTKTQNFMIRRGFSINSFAVLNNVLLYVDSEGRILIYESGNTIGGLQIMSYWETPTFDLGYKNGRKDIQYIYFIGKGSGSIRISCTTERGTKYKDVALSTSDTLYKIKLRNKGKMLKFKFENINGSTFCIKNPQIEYEIDYD
jgi:hypothetical protein